MSIVETIGLTSGLDFAVERTEIRKFDSGDSKPPSSTVSVLKFIFISLVVAIVLTFGFIFFCNPTLVRGSSMSPTMRDGQVWFSRRVVLGKPSRGDIIRAYSRDDMVNVVKRVVASSGDKVTVTDDGIYVNGLLVDNSEETNRVLGDSTTWLSNHNGTSYRLGKGEYFVLGDNRNDSKDSRYYGIIPERDVQTVVTGRSPSWLSWLFKPRG